MILKVLKISALSTILGLSLNANDFNLRGEGVDITYNEKEFTIKRMHDEECKTINGADPKNIWSGNYAKEGLPQKCIKSFVTTVGKITPMKINDTIKTIGEIEVIEFIKKSSR